MRPNTKPIEIEDPQDMQKGQIEPPTAGAEAGIQEPTADISGQDLELPANLQAEVSMEQHDSVQEPKDISDQPMQKRSLSQQSQASGGNLSPPKRPRLSGYNSFKESQQLPQPVLYDQAKENVLPSVEPQQLPAKHDEAGPSGIQHVRPEVDAEPRAAPSIQGASNGSESSESQLGSLHRTQDSSGYASALNMTDSQKFIQNHWGTESTMWKIVSKIKAGRRPVTVETLVAEGPVLEGCKRIIAASCFTSILKLKQHGFIRITKDPETLEIQDISLGPRFDSL